MLNCHLLKRKAVGPHLEHFLRGCREETNLSVGVETIEVRGLGGQGRVDVLVVTLHIGSYCCLHFLVLLVLLLLLLLLLLLTL